MVYPKSRALPTDSISPWHDKINEGNACVLEHVFWHITIFDLQAQGC